MKKNFLITALLLLISGSVSAQTPEKNIFTIRGGVNLSDFSTDYTPTDTKVGFRVGATYERVLSRKLPLYLETGLICTQTGCRDFDHDKINGYSLQIPVMINYKFRLSEQFALYPSVGLYYAVGMGGHIKNGFRETLTYGDDGNLSRSDFGCKFAATLVWRRFLVTAGYEVGLNQLNQSEYAYSPTMPAHPAWDDELYHRNLFISVGYKF